MASTGTAPLYRRHDNAFAGALTFLVGRRPHGVEGFARHAVSGHNQYVGFVGDLELISSTLTAVAQRIKEPLSPDQFVERRALTRYEIAAFESTLDRATKEADMQLFLEANPQILMQQLDVGVGAWVIPKQRLGAEHETDFLIAHEASGGLVWHAVELERPQARLFIKNGDASAALNHAIRQIEDWRDWLSRNRDYATRPRERAGLGLRDIDPRLSGLVVIGRGSDPDAQITRRRRALADAHRAVIETYDSLLSSAKERLLAGQPDFARAANEVTRWQELSALTDEPLPGPVREVLLTNIDPAKYSGSQKIAFYSLNEWTDEIPSDYEDFITEVIQILARTESRLTSVRYFKPGDYVILTPSGYITSSQSDQIERAAENLLGKYMLAALVYDA